MKNIPIAKPCLGEEEAEAAKRVILSGWVAQGPEVEAFEQELASYVGAPHACAVSNCTAALHLALMTVGVEPGDEVITVSHSFVATVNCIRHCGATPVFVDVERSTYNIDPTLVEGAITPRTKAILVVHQLGLPCDLPAILATAQKHGLPVVEDAACAIGSEICCDGKWERIGKPHGEIACFSFHPRKAITTGDGGMLTAADPEHDRPFRLLRNQGMSRPATARHGAKAVTFEEYPVVGYNCRLTDIQAAVGREQLKRLPAMIQHRREIAEQYCRQLAQVPGIDLPREPDWARSNWQSFCIGLPPDMDQRGAMQSLLEAGISSRRGVMCAHREPAFRGTPQAHSLEVSEHLQDHSIMLPIHTYMDEGDVDRVVRALAEAVATERG